MKRSLAISAMMALFAALAFAADLSGSWVAKVDLGSQGGEPKFVLKQDGEKLSGTYSGALGDAPIHGTVKGNDVQWDFEAAGAEVHYKGKFDAQSDKIEGTVDYGGQASGTFTATRSGEKKK